MRVDITLVSVTSALLLLFVVACAAPASSTSASATTVPAVTATIAPPVIATAVPRQRTAASSPCFVDQIKGNLNSKIYHVPRGEFYARTSANVACFDTTVAAQGAGFRPSER